MAAADTSCSVRTEGGKRDDGVLETVAMICSRLASKESGDGEAVVESLRELQRVHMTFEALEATKIGRAVNALRKNAPSEQARQLAAALYTGWKAVVDERFRSSCTPPQPPPKADKGIEKRSCSSPLSPVEAKQSARSDGHSDGAAPTSVVVEKTAETTLRVHEEFGTATIVNKPSSIRVRVINTNAPGKAEQRRVTVARRTTAIPEPAPASNTATRDGGGPNSKQQANCATTVSHQGTNAAAKRVCPAGAAPSTTTKAPPTALPKLVVGSSGACKRKAEDPTVFDDEARLARAGARLREGYKVVSNAKEKRKIKEIKAIDAQRMEKKARQRPVQYLRCTAAHRTRTGTGRQAPVPCPPRMPRAF